MERKWIIIAASAAAVLLLGWWLMAGTGEEVAEITVPVKKGRFEITVNSAGELEPVNSVSIRGPRGLRESGIREFKVDKLVPEGTVVERNAFIAELDKSELFNRFTEEKDQLTKEQAQYTQTQLDTALELRQARDEILNLEFNVEEKKIVLEQSAFEPPATIKQAEIELEKARRDLRQARENYNLKKEQARAKMTEAYINLTKRKNDVNFIADLLKKFTIRAPQSGMVIYSKSWDGRKIREGSTVSSWNPVVATLPDLSSMLSVTFINEVDIMKVKKGQSVYIGLDAFPDKKFTGVIQQVANVGEQKPNSDAKVFEVSVLLNETDTALRPAMTTSNLIVSDVVEDALFVPLETLHSQGDSITYVFRKEGIGVEKQEIFLGQTNENQAVVLQGLNEGDVVYLSTPADMEESPINRLTIKKDELAGQ